MVAATLAEAAKVGLRKVMNVSMNGKRPATSTSHPIKWHLQLSEQRAKRAGSPIIILGNCRVKGFEGFSCFYSRAKRKILAWRNAKYAYICVSHHQCPDKYIVYLGGQIYTVSYSLVSR